MEHTHTTYTITSVTMGAMVLATLAVAPVSYGQTNVNATLESQGNISTSTLESDTMVDMDTTIQSANNEENAQLDASVDTNINARADMFSDTANVTAQANSATGTFNARITVDGQLINADTYSNTGTQLSGSIDSGEKLAMYAQLVADSDAGIETINTSDQSVELSYLESARFLGMDVNSSRTARVTVDEQGALDIQVSKPWWSLFVSGSTATNADIRAEVQDQLSMQSMTDASLDWETQAQVISAIETAMRIHLGANTQATVTQ